MGLSELDRNSALAPESLARVEEAIAGSDETVVSHLLDPAASNDVRRALRAVLKVSQAVLGTHRFDDALEVIAEQNRWQRWTRPRFPSAAGNASAACCTP